MTEPQHETPTKDLSAWCGIGVAMTLIALFGADQIGVRWVMALCAPLAVLIIYILVSGVSFKIDWGWSGDDDEPPTAGAT